MPSKKQTILLSPRGFKTLTQPHTGEVPQPGDVVILAGDQFPVRSRILDGDKVTVLLGVTPLTAKIVDGMTKDEIHELGEKLEVEKTWQGKQDVINVLVRTELEGTYGFQDELNSLLG